MVKIIPVIRIQQQLNSLRAQLILNKVKKLSKLQFAALALIVDLPSQRAVQVDKFASRLIKMSKQKKFPIYGFTLSSCSPQSYYLLSISHKIYASPTTMFSFRRQAKQVSYSNLYNMLEFKRMTIGSRQNLIGKYVDNFTPPDMVRLGNKKASDIDERLIKYSLINRKQKIQNLSLKSEDIPSLLLGQEAKEKKIVDDYGVYEEVLRNEFPKVQIIRIESAGEIGSLFKTLAILTSPILIMIFLFKVFLKYSLLFYIWMKAKATGRKNLAQVVEEGGYELDEDQAQWIKQYDEENKYQTLPSE